MEAKPEKKETPFQRFERTMRHIVSVPKKEVERRIAEEREQRKAKKKDN